jgi:hypothetical protein
MGWLSAMNITFRLQILHLNIEISRESVSTRDGGTCYKLPELGFPEGDRGSDYVVNVFVFLGSIILCRF